MKIKIIQTQKVLSPTQITLSDYVINPYRGCGFGCLYCYAQENKNVDKGDFFNTLGVKVNAPEILAKELKYKKPKRVLLGSTTECFPYAESKYKITQKILKILNKHKIPYTILTKSHLVADYLPLMAKNPENQIYFTLNSASDKAIRILEKKSPSLPQRLKAIRKILQSRVRLRIHIGPYIPCLSQLGEILKILPGGIKEIDIELYHKKQGNFKSIWEAIKRSENRNKAIRIKQIYRTAESYQQFVNELRGEIKNLKAAYPCKIYYVAPDFNQYYTDKITYQKPL